MHGGVLRRLIPRLLARSEAETSRLIVGSTGSGKSEGELVDLVRLAARGDTAVVLLDGHGTLAFRAAGQWVARGHVQRLIYEPLSAIDRVLAWPMLVGSTAADPSRRRLEDEETREEVAQCFLAQRNLATVADKPHTREWLDAAIDLCLAQPKTEPLSSLVDAFRVGTAAYGRLLADARDPVIVEKFRDIEWLKRKSAVQYEIQTGASRRLLELVCASEAVRLRCRQGPFSWPEALRSRSLIAIDGGGLRGRETKRALFLLASLQVIQAVRRQFAESRSPLPVVLVLEEAGALGLVTPFILAALMELRKAGLSLHLLTQSSLDFGDAAVFEALLANTPWVGWYRSLSPQDQEIGAMVMATPTFSPHAVHYTRERAIAAGIRHVGRVIVTRYRTLTDAYYASPALHEQLYRTHLAALQVGERLVRDSSGVRRERVRMLRPPRRLRAEFDALTAAAIARVRRQPIYLPAAPAQMDRAPREASPAAARLQRAASSVGPPRDR